MRNKKIFGVIFREKPALLLLQLLKEENEIYASTVSKKIDCTYSHVVKLLKEMHKAGLINFQKRGRLKILTLSKKGEDFTKLIDSAINIL